MDSVSKKRKGVPVSGLAISGLTSEFLNRRQRTTSRVFRELRTSGPSESKFDHIYISISIEIESIEIDSIFLIISRVERSDVHMHKAPSF